MRQTKEASVRLLFSSFWRAVLYCLHPKVILLSFLPLLIAIGAAGLMAYLFWQSAQDALLSFLDASVFVNSLAAWLAAVGLPALKSMLAPLILIVVLTPLVVASTVLLVSTMMTPALVRMVADRRFPVLERRHGASFLASVGWALISCALALVATILTSPMWIVPPLVLILPPAIWAWLTYRVMAFDALADHASSAERQTLLLKHKPTLIVMGFVVGFLGATPSLLWSMGLMAIAMAPLLLPLSVWLYTLVFVFASLWYVHFCLAALQMLRAQHEAEVFVPTRPLTTMEVLAASDMADAIEMPTNK
jgi:hypothetical protein